MTIEQDPFIIPNDPIILKKLVGYYYKYIHIDAEEGVLGTGYNTKYYFRIFLWVKNDEYSITVPKEKRNGVYLQNGYGAFLNINTIDKDMKLGHWDGGAGFNFLMPRDLKSLGLGSIIINHLLWWAKQNYSEYDMCPIMLADIDATPDNIMRRNRLWSKPGLVKIGEDNQVIQGAKKVGELNPVIETRGFEIFRGEDYDNLSFKILNDMLSKEETYSSVRGAVLFSENDAPFFQDYKSRYKTF